MSFMKSSKLRSLKHREFHYALAFRMPVYSEKQKQSELLCYHWNLSEIKQIKVCIRYLYACSSSVKSARIWENIEDHFFISSFCQLGFYVCIGLFNCNTPTYFHQIILQNFIQLIKYIFMHAFTDFCLKLKTIDAVNWLDGIAKLPESSKMSKSLD